MLREDILLGCAITEKETHQRNSPLTLAKLTVFPDVKLQKCLMGHRDERRLLASPMFQHWIEFCKTHSEIRLQAVEVELLTQAEMEERRSALMNQNTISNNSNSSKSSSSSGIVVNSSASTSSSSAAAAQPPQIPLPPVPTAAAGGTTSGVTPQSNKRSKVESLLLRPLKLLGRDKNYVAHEVEDSIIFLTKSDLEKIEAQKRGLLRNSTSQLSISGGTAQLDQPQQHPQSNTISDKMKVFEQENKRTGNSGGGGGWFSDRKNKSNNNKTKSFTSYDILHKKLTANDRYCDMSKMLEERFGDLTANTLMKANAKAIAVGKGPNKSSSVTDISAGGGGNREINMNQMLGSRYSLNKTFSLENISLYDMQPRSRHSFSASQTPDLVRIINQHQKQGRMNSSAASSVENIGQLYPTTSSSQCLSSIGGGSGGGRVVDETSFISEKLYSEFHVKTKLHSKSSTHLNRWPFQAKQNNGMGQSQQHKRMKKTSSIVNITSDYGSVQDLLQGQSQAVTSVAPSSVAVQPSRITILHKAHKDVTKEFINTNTDEYYAEICNDQNTHHHHQHNHTSRTQIVNVL